jgi:hypothetical protein
MSTILDKTLVRADHCRSFRVHRAPLIGWEASAREDERIVEQQHYSD